MATAFCVVFVTAPGSVVARRIATTLVKERLAACASIVPGLTSFYRWKGKFESGREVLLVIKARRSRLPALEKRVGALHPYEVPEIISLPIVRGNPSYLTWLADQN
jgi:periplasmic divalent cation tolerance protein